MLGQLREHVLLSIRWHCTAWTRRGGRGRIQIEVLEETAEKAYLVIPSNRVAISEEQLDAASGGMCNPSSGHY